MLRYHVIESHEANDIHDCLTKCWGVTDCESINYYFDGRCELNTGFKEKYPKDFEEEQSAIYFKNIDGGGMPHKFLVYFFDFFC